MGIHGQDRESRWRTESFDCILFVGLIVKNGRCSRKVDVLLWPGVAGHRHGLIAGLPVGNRPVGHSTTF